MPKDLQLTGQTRNGASRRGVVVPDRDLGLDPNRLYLQPGSARPGTQVSPKA